MDMNGHLLQAAFRKFMVKMVFNNLMVFLGSIVNGIVISRFLGTGAMAAFQITLPLVFVVMMFSQIISMGVQNNCAKSIGAGRLEEAREYYSLAVIFALPFSLMLAAFTWCQAEFLAELLGAKGAAAALSADAADYLRGISPGLPLLIFLPMQISVLFLEGRAKCALRAIFVQTAVNIIGVFANVLYFGGGMMGMGMVMSLSYFVSLCVMSGGVFSGGGHISFTRCGLHWRKMLSILRIGLPSAIDRFYKSTQMFVVNSVLLRVAPGTAIAAFADINALNNIFNPIVMGLSATALTMAGVFTGERDRNSLHRLLHISVKNAVMVTSLTAMATFLAAPLLIGLFVEEEGAAFDAAVRALRIYIWYLPVYAVNNVLQKYYLGVNALKMTYLTSLLDNFLFICLLAVVLGHFFGADGVWFSFLLAELLTLGTLSAVIAWKKKGIPKGIGDFLCLPKKMASKPFAKSAASMEEIVAISEEARQFLLAHGAPRREAMLMALSIEEMGGNIIRWGFGDGKKHSIDILIVEEEDEKTWAMRIRDDCRAFDPKEWLSLHRKEDPARNIGIRTICGMAGEVRYSRTLGLNYLWIRL